MIQSRQGITISAPEEIACINGFIDKDKLMESAKAYGKSPYGEHLKAVTEGNQDGIARHIVDYRDSRDATLRMRDPPRLVVSTGGRPLTRDSAEGMFSEIRWSLLDRGQFFAGRKPRLRDL